MSSPSRRQVSGGLNWLTVMSWLVCLVVLGTVVAGIFVVGSPAEARRVSADAQRVSDLEAITRGVRSYYSKHKSLPAKIEDVYSDGSLSLGDGKDPETGASYSYRIVDPAHFELGAVFQTDQRRSQPGYYGYGVEILPFWKHAAGSQRFILSATAPRIES